MTSNESGRPNRRGPAKPRGLPKPIPAKQAFLECSTSLFKARNSNEIKASHDIIAQKRAIRAINMGLGIRKPGYNIYLAGIQGTGKTSVIRHFLSKSVKKTVPPNDWIYVYNFQTPESPRAIELGRGEGKILRKKMQAIVKSLRVEIPTALQSEDYENAVNAHLSAANERKSKLFSDLDRLAKGMGFVIKSSRIGIETIPVKEGRSITEKEYNKLTEPERKKIEEKRGTLEPEVLDFARKVRGIEKDSRDFVENLRCDLGNQIVSSFIDPLLDKHEEEDVREFLNEFKDDVLTNLLDFAEDEEKDEEERPSFFGEKDKFSKYQINLFVDNSKIKHAPIIIETNPTYYNLFGKIEKNVEHGMYLTDFTKIKSGAIHRANGGYLVLNALDIFKAGNIWETLKRVLRNQEGFIEDMGEQYSLLPTSGLRPQAMPLDIKVILIGNDEIYHVLFDQDEEFPKIFKIKADFDYKMPRNSRNIQSYFSFVATRSQVEKLLPFDKSAIAAIVEFGSRLVEDQNQLSTQFGKIKDLSIESDYIARESEVGLVKRIHVEQALDQKFFRLNLHEQSLHEMVKAKDILLTVDGSCVGQINGLAVYDYGDISFGKLSRITCTTSASDSGIINIERASKLSGRIHDKGILILSGLINSLLARERPLGFSASICFEQSYGIVDGDSASVAELIVVISAMAKIPIKQNFAVTGSVNQMGEVQVVGGINEKIEGFLKTVSLVGKSKEYAVIIPQGNLDNLMLSLEVRQAIKLKKLLIYPVSHIWQAFELITGVPLGTKDVNEGIKFTSDSALAMIEKLQLDLEKLSASTKS